MTYTTTTATQVTSFINSIGVNTHLDFTNSSYGSLSRVESAINYLGVKNLRDAANSRADLGANGLCQQVANATGAKFDAFLGEGSAATMASGLAHAVPLAGQGILNAIEGGNEPAATALHNLTTLLADTGGSFTPDSLSYRLSGVLSTDHSMLMEKSDGTFWMAIWNETRLSGPKAPVDISVPDHTVTLSLALPAGNVTVYDPLTGTSAVQSANDTSSVQISVPDHYWANQLASLSQADQSQGLVHSLAQASGGFNGSMTIADGFLSSGEFQGLYGGLGNHAFVNQLYENALNRPADAAGAQYWDNLLDSGAATKAMVLVGIAESGEASQVHANLLLTV